MARQMRHTVQGFELTFGVNHLGCFAFTVLLLPKLMETPGSSTVVMSSGQHKDAKIEWEDLNAEKSYKMAPALWRQQAREFALRLRAVPVAAGGGSADDGRRLPPWLDKRVYLAKL